LRTLIPVMTVGFLFLFLGVPRKFFEVPSRRGRRRSLGGPTVRAAEQA